MSGLSYETETIRGVTGEDGSFRYRPGETIAFYVGDVSVGDRVVAKGEMSPVDIVEGSWLPESRLETNQLMDFYWSARSGPAKDIDAELELLNTLSFLQSLDTDKDRANGILIHPDAGAALKGATLQLGERGAFEDHPFALRRVLYPLYDAGLVESHDLRVHGRGLLRLLSLGLRSVTPGRVRRSCRRDGCRFPAFPRESPRSGGRARWLRPSLPAP